MRRKMAQASVRVQEGQDRLQKCQNFADCQDSVHDCQYCAVKIAKSAPFARVRGRAGVVGFPGVKCAAYKFVSGGAAVCGKFKVPSGRRCRGGMLAQLQHTLQNTVSSGRIYS